MPPPSLMDRTLFSKANDILLNGNSHPHIIFKGLCYLVLITSTHDSSCEYVHMGGGACRLEVSDPLAVVVEGRCYEPPDMGVGNLNSPLEEEQVI